MKELQTSVRAAEPGNRLYALHATEQANEYFMLERYDDAAALVAHHAAGYFLEASRTLEECFASPPEVRVMSEV